MTIKAKPEEAAKVNSPIVIKLHLLGLTCNFFDKCLQAIFVSHCVIVTQPRSTLSTFLSSSKEAHLLSDGVSIIACMYKIYFKFFDCWIRWIHFVSKCWICDQAQLPWPLLSPLPPWLRPPTALLSVMTKTSSSWLDRWSIPNIPFFQASGDMSPQKAVALGKLKVRGNFLLLQKLQGIFWTFLRNIFRGIHLKFVISAILPVKIYFHIYRPPPHYYSVDHPYQLVKFVSYILV